MGSDAGNRAVGDMTAPIEPSRSEESSGISQAGPENPPFKASRSLVLAFVSICIITLAAALDATSLSIAVPTITEHLSGTAIEAFWSGTSFLIASAVVQPVFGGLSHVFGRKNLILVSAFLFALGSLIPAVAPNFTVLLAGRTIQGLGGGGVLMLGDIVITDLIPLTVRGTWLGYLSGIWAIGTVAGPIMGGGFAGSSGSGWRWIFWINLPIIGIGTVTVIFFLKMKLVSGGLVAKVKKFDWFGSLIFVASSVAYLMPLTWGGVLYEWNSWRTIVPLLLGLVGIGATGYYEYWLSTKAFDADGNAIPGDHIQPIIRFGIFHNWTMRLLYLQTFIHGVILWALLYYLPLYYEAVKGYRPVIAGVSLLPETLLIAPMSILAGVVSSKVGSYRWAIWVGWGLSTLGFGLLYLLDTDTSIPAFIFLNVPVSMGTGMCFVSMALGVQAAGRPADAGHSITFYTFIRVFGQALGVAVGGVVFQNEFRNRLLEYPLLAANATRYSEDATAILTFIHNMKDAIMKAQLIQAYADALKVIWVVMTALSGAVFLSSFFIKAYSLNQKHETEQGLTEKKNRQTPGDEESGNGGGH